MPKISTPDMTYEMAVKMVLTGTDEFGADQLATLKAYADKAKKIFHELGIKKTQIQKLDEAKVTFGAGWNRKQQDQFNKAREKLLTESRGLLSEAEVHSLFMKALSSREKRAKEGLEKILVRAGISEAPMTSQETNALRKRNKEENAAYAQNIRHDKKSKEKVDRQNAAGQFLNDNGTRVNELLKMKKEGANVEAWDAYERRLMDTHYKRQAYEKRQADKAEAAGQALNDEGTREAQLKKIKDAEYRQTQNDKGTRDAELKSIKNAEYLKKLNEEGVRKAQLKARKDAEFRQKQNEDGYREMELKKIKAANKAKAKVDALAIKEAASKPPGGGGPPSDDNSVNGLFGKSKPFRMLARVRLAAELSQFVANTIKNMTYQPIEDMAKIKISAEQAGMTPREFQESKYSADQSMMSEESFLRGVKFLQREMEDSVYVNPKTGKKSATKSSRALEKIQYIAQDGKSFLPITQVLDNMADHMASLDLEKRSAYASSIFAESSQHWIPFLSKGSAHLKEMRKEAEKLGYVLSNDVVEGSFDIWNEIRKISTAGNGLVAGFFEGAMGDVGKATKGAAEWLSTFRPIVKEIGKSMGEMVEHNKDKFTAMNTVFGGLSARFMSTSSTIHLVEQALELMTYKLILSKAASGESILKTEGLKLAFTGLTTAIGSASVQLLGFLAIEDILGTLSGKDTFGTRWANFVNTDISNSNLSKGMQGLHYLLQMTADSATVLLAALLLLPDVLGITDTDSFGVLKLASNRLADALPTDFTRMYGIARDIGNNFSPLGAIEYKGNYSDIASNVSKRLDLKSMANATLGQGSISTYSSQVEGATTRNLLTGRISSQVIPSIPYTPSAQPAAAAPSSWLPSFNLGNFLTGYKPGTAMTNLSYLNTIQTPASAPVPMYAGAAYGPPSALAQQKATQAAAAQPQTTNVVQHMSFNITMQSGLDPQEIGKAIQAASKQAVMSVPNSPRSGNK